MAGFLLTGSSGEMSERYIAPGDLALGGEVITTITSGAATTLTAQAMLGGIIIRAGASAARTDVSDSSINILTALCGQNLTTFAQVANGINFRFRVLNTSAFVVTLSNNTGVTLASGSFAIAATSFRDFLVTVNAISALDMFQCQLTSGSPNVYFVLSAGQQSVPVTPAGNGLLIVPGATVQGTGISGTITGLIWGQGGVIGFTCSANASATIQTNVTFLPSIQIDSIGSGSL